MRLFFFFVTVYFFFFFTSQEQNVKVFKKTVALEETQKIFSYLFKLNILINFTSHLNTDRFITR